MKKVWPSQNHSNPLSRSLIPLDDDAALFSMVICPFHWNFHSSNSINRHVPFPEFCTYLNPDFELSHLPKANCLPKTRHNSFENSMNNQSVNVMSHFQIVNFINRYFNEMGIHRLKIYKKFDSPLWGTLLLKSSSVTILYIDFV